VAQNPLRKKTAIVGVGTSDWGQLHWNPDPLRDKVSLGIEALRAALDDAGLSINQIDGLVTSAVTDADNYPAFAYRAGLRSVRFLAPYPASGRMCGVALAHAAMAVHAGLANYVALVYSTTNRSVKNQFGGGQGGDLYDPVFGMTSPGAQYAMLYSRYVDRYGYRGRDELLGAVPIAFRKHAMLNPTAVMRDPLTLDAYLKARYIARPLRLHDYCLICDGATAYIVTSAERAKDLRKPPAYIASFAEHSTLWEMYVPPEPPEEYWYSYAQTMAKEVFERSGFAIKDVSVFQVYDNFSPDVLWSLEGVGFCPRGEALRWIQGGRIELGGELPVNTSGGMLSEVYLQGWNLVAEAVRQLRGECGARQVRNCNVVLYVCLAGVSSMVLLSSA